MWLRKIYFANINKLTLEIDQLDGLAISAVCKRMCMLKV